MQMISHFEVGLPGEEVLRHHLPLFASSFKLDSFKGCWLYPLLSLVMCVFLTLWDAEEGGGVYPHFCHKQLRRFYIQRRRRFVVTTGSALPLCGERGRANVRACQQEGHEGASPADHQDITFCGDTEMAAQNFLHDSLVPDPLRVGGFCGSIFLYHTVTVLTEQISDIFAMTKGLSVPHATPPTWLSWRSGWTVDPELCRHVGGGWGCCACVSLCLCNLTLII